MIQYAVCEIKGKQYQVWPDKNIKVDFLGEEKTLLCDKVLLKVEDGKMDFGKPFLKETLLFDVIGVSKDKIRVAKYHPKANSRKVIGAKSRLSIIKLAQKREK